MATIGNISTPYQDSGYIRMMEEMHRERSMFPPSLAAEIERKNRIRTAHLPTHPGDSEITREIKKLTVMQENSTRRSMTEDPYGTTFRKNIRAEFSLVAQMNWIERNEMERAHESGHDVMTNYDAIAEGIKDEILRFARRIVQDRKGLTR